jgi:lipopolysaccharide export system protein LptA
MSRAKILLALVAVAAALVLIFLPHGGDEPADDATAATAISLYGYDDGDLLWEIRAAHGRIDGDEQTLHGVEVAFHGDGDDPLQIRGEQLERSGDSARLSGDIRIERTDDLFLETEALTWIEADERLEAGPIVLLAEALTISAERFGYDLVTGSSSFTGHVEASADLGSDWTIRAERAEEQDGIVTFDGTVTAESGEEGAFRCDRLEVDSEAQQVRLLGDVDGEWASVRLNAGSIEMDDDGLRAADRVSARLDLQEMGGADDS